MAAASGSRKPCAPCRPWYRWPIATLPFPPPNPEIAMRLRPAVLLASVFAVVSCQQPQPKPAALSDADRAALRAVFDSTVARLSAKNFTGWSNQFTADGRLFPPNHPVVTGRAGLKAWADSLPPFAGFSFGDVAVDGEGDMATGSSSYTITWNPPGAPSMPDKGKQLVTFHRQTDGSWLVTAAAFSSDLPMPGGAAPLPAPAKPKK